MLSRVAGNVYWLFRYLERAQNIARFVNADFSQYLENHRNQGNLWASLVAVTGDQDFFYSHYDSPSKDALVHFLTLDEEYPSSIYRCVSQARENARSVRESISSEMWEELNSLYLAVNRYRNGASEHPDPYLFCRSVISSCYHFIGLFYSTMNRTEAWHFGRMGMLLERADKTSRILDVKYFILLPDPNLVGSAYDNTQWTALLKAVSGLEMYRKEYRRMNPTDVAKFLILDPNFPRSIRHCVRYTEESLALVSRASPSSGLNSAQKSVYRIRADLETSSVEDVFAVGLHQYLDDLQTRMNQVDEDIFHVFLELKIAPKGESVHGQLGQAQS